MIKEIFNENLKRSCYQCEFQNECNLFYCIIENFKCTGPPGLLKCSLCKTKNYCLNYDILLKISDEAELRKVKRYIKERCKNEETRTN